MKARKKFTLRLVWYSVLIWFLAIVVGELVVLPWFYLILPLVVFWTTVYYFRNEKRTFAAGLKVALFWFLAVSILSFLEIIGPYYANAIFYFSDGRNWFLYPLILLTPVIYSLISENRSKRKSPKRRFKIFRSLETFQPT